MHPRETAEPPRSGRWLAPLAFLTAAIVLMSALLGWSQLSRTTANRRIGDGQLRSATAAVVDINTSQITLGTDGLRPLGAGSGIVLTGDGEILTNNHVIEGASSIRVTVEGQGAQTATVLGVDPTDDVALLKLSGASGLPAARIGDSSTVQVGDAVTAIGNAFGRGGAPTVTQGSVTGVHQTVTANDPTGGGSERLRDAIRTSASIAPGDSGGALVDANGRVIGIITAGPRDSGSGGGGFAIPIGAALDIVNQIEAGRGSSTILIGERGFLGVAAQPVAPAIAARLGLSDGSGVQVAGVFPDTPADRAGMTAPAVIRTIDGISIDSPDALGSALHAKTPGQRVRITWVDQQGSHSATVALIAGPAV